MRAFTISKLFAHCQELALLIYDPITRCIQVNYHATGAKVKITKLWKLPDFNRVYLHCVISIRRDLNVNIDVVIKHRTNAVSKCMCVHYTARIFST